MYISIYDRFKVKELKEELRQEVRQEGRQEGIKAGIKEVNLEIARRMLAAGMSPDFIAGVTELPLEEINGLKD
ncbi:MAG: hypothetical protein LBF58_01800 [Deltaproteobacteria bacterium]|nr:hypothetical protein [Deltaproteobacteria bacterium]